MAKMPDDPRRAWDGGCHNQVDDRREILAGQIGNVAEHRLRRRINIADTKRAIDQIDAERRIIENRLQLRLRLPQCFLSLLALKVIRGLPRQQAIDSGAARSRRNDAIW